MRPVIFPILALTLSLFACAREAASIDGSAGSDDGSSAAASQASDAKGAAGAKASSSGTTDAHAEPTTDTDATEPEALPAIPEAGPPKPATQVLLEVVLVVMKDARKRTWYCTGTLISKDTVVTAGHCLERGRFDSYEIIAPLADGSPTVAATAPLPMSDDFDDIANPDVGFLKLETSIDLPAYAVLTDISKDVEAGKPFTAAGVFREEEKPISPLHEVKDLAVKSTTNVGYKHGFGVTLFSKGGDSGAGLFLVEGGHVTHKLIGVARQPDFDSATDQLTRIDPEVLAWLTSKGAM